MRFDFRLHGRLGDGRACFADMSVYADPADAGQASKEASIDAVWLIQEPGYPDVPDNAEIVVERVEDLNERKEKACQSEPQLRMIAPGVFAGSGGPGSLAAFLKKIGAGDLVFPPEENPNGP